MDSVEENKDRFARSMRHKRNGEYESALVLLQSIVADQPDNAEAFHEIGLIQFYQVNCTESITALKKAVALDPGSLVFLKNLGKTHEAFGDYDSASDVYERILRRENGGPS